MTDGNGHDVQAQISEIHGEVRRLDGRDDNHSLRLTDALGRLVGIENTQVEHGVLLRDILRKLGALCAKAGV